MKTSSVKPTLGFDEYGGAEVNGPGSYSCLFRQKEAEPNEAEGKKEGNKSVVKISEQNTHSPVIEKFLK